MTIHTTTHTPITFTVKVYNAKGEWLDHRHYHTPNLNLLGGHWAICKRMAESMLKANKKAKSVRYFMDDVEYVYNSKEWEFVKA